jgi:nucleotidyltransferase/DNA polymerase involved in DNA repair
MRKIVHLDADAFFASVEQAADVRLRGKAMAVGGESRGIIASASYEARKFGIYTPMPTARARKLCPKLIVLPGDYERYEQFSPNSFCAHCKRAESFLLEVLTEDCRLFPFGKLRVKTGATSLRGTVTSRLQKAHHRDAVRCRN